MADLDLTGFADCLELVSGVADFLAATEARALARRKIVRLARRLVADPTLTDDEVVPVAYARARAAHLELVAAGGRP